MGSIVTDGRRGGMVSHGNALPSYLASSVCYGQNRYGKGLVVTGSQQRYSGARTSIATIASDQDSIAPSSHDTEG